jgi:hypothetical protein
MTTPFDGEAWGELFSKEVREFVERSAKKIKDDLRTEFEARFAALEEHTPKYCGTFVKGQAYHRGQLVTHAGSLWHCRAGETGSTPGTDANWQLAVKAGTFSK